MKLCYAKSAVLGLIPFFIALPAMADHLTCSLESEGTYKIVTLNLADAKTSEAGTYSDAVYDLSFHLSATCQDRKCEADITIDSSEIEDEVGSLSFEFERSFKDQKVLDEPLTDTPDGRSYNLSCQYASDT